MSALTLLFIPVSATDGIGEYRRSLVIANQLQQQWPTASIYFLLNKAVSYLASCPYKVITTQGSATKDSPKVIATITELKPDLVLFDASGRGEHFKVAKQVGAKVGFISQHAKKRARGLKLNRLPYVDFHWVVQPDFAIKPLSLFERLKAKFYPEGKPVNVGAVFELPTAQQQRQTLAKLQLRQPFVVFNAGSGGFKVGKQVGCAEEGAGQAEYAIDILYRIACQFSEQTGIQSVVVFGQNYPKTLPSNSQVIALSSLDNKAFISLLLAAKLRVISAGDTLLQCIALALPTFAVSVTKDQPKRLARCSELGLTKAVSLTASNLPTLLAQFLVEGTNAREAEREALVEALAQVNQTKTLGLDYICQDIIGALAPRS